MKKINDKNISEQITIKNKMDGSIRFDKNKDLKIILEEKSVASFTWEIKGQKKVKNNIKFYLKKGANLTIYASYNLNKKSDITHNIEIFHIGEKSESKIELRSVLSDESQLKILGQINVEKNCKKVNANLLHKTLLLSKKSKVSTKPELKIANDDVKCSHGATIGSLDEQTIYYMKSRGIENSEAKQILIDAFLK